MATALEFSRPSAVAAALGADGAQRFTEKSVLLCGEAGSPLTVNGHETFRAAFLMLIRICQNVCISLPPGCDDLLSDIGALGRRMVPERTLEVIDQRFDRNKFDAILSVGTASHADLPWTTINSDGWLAWVSSRGGNLPIAGNRPNSIGAMGAACLGVAEVFKRLIALRPNRGHLLDVSSFSFWTYEAGSEDVGPALDPLVIDVALIGCGAIGSGTAYLLSRMAVSGRAFALDRQDFGPENFGTSIVLGPGDYRRHKAQVVSELLQSKLQTRAMRMEIGEFQSIYDGSHPDVVLTGLDDIDPRHEVQHLWPGLVIDGAVGGELSCQVSCHPWNSDIACLLCLFQKGAARDLAQMYASATGLPAEIANDPNALVTEELIVGAPENRRLWLRDHLGKRLCSITSEAVVKFLSAESHRDGFAPAVPFVSCLSACMVVTELVRYVTTGRTSPAPRFQLNLLWGPQRGAHFDENRREDCFCSERAESISRLRKTRTHLIQTCSGHRAETV